MIRMCSPLVEAGDLISKRRCLLPKGDSGFSLMLVMVTAASMMTVLLAFLTMLSYQKTQNKAIQQKLEIVAFEQSLQKLLEDSHSCECMFVTTQATPLTLNTANTNPIPLTLRRACGAAANWLQAGADLPGSDSGIKIENVNLETVTSLGGSIVSAELNISFQAGTILGGLRPIKLIQGYQVNAANQITTCLNSYATKLAALCAKMTGSSFNPVTLQCTVTSTTQAGLTPSLPPGSPQPGSPCVGPTAGGGFVTYDIDTGGRTCCEMSWYRPMIWFTGRGYARRFFNTVTPVCEPF